MFSIFNFGKPKIELYSVIPGIENLSPPIRAQDDVLPKWVKTHSQITKNILKEDGALTKTAFCIERCPGIRGLLDQGIHIKTWQDIKLVLHKDGKYEWDSPTKVADLINGRLISPDVQSHAGSQFPEFCSARNDTWPNIIKIMSNWRISISKGWHFLMLPNYYSDNQWFSAVPGIYNPEFGKHININLQIHINEGQVFFPAGTTLVKMIPIKKNQNFDLKIREVTEKDLVKERATLAAIRKSFWASRKEQLQDIENIYKNTKCPFLSSLFQNER